MCVCVSTRARATRLRVRSVIARGHGNARMCAYGPIVRFRGGYDSFYPLGSICVHTWGTAISTESLLYIKTASVRTHRSAVTTGSDRL